MKKYSVFFLSGLVLGLFCLSLSSCKDDEPVKYNLTFSKSTSTAIESDAKIEIEIKLDKPAPEDITVDFELNGSAYDDVRAAETDDEYPDFTVDGDYGEIKILKGEAIATISLIPFSDTDVEDDETIEITLKSVSNTSVLFESTAKTTITLNQEDGMAVLLDWPAAGTDGVADMDILVRMGETAADPDWDGILTGSVGRGFERNYEGVFIPKTFTGEYFGLDYSDATYGLTYTYYDGDLDPLNFTVTYIDFINGDFEPEAQQQVFEQSYTVANKNKWVNTEEGVPTIIAQKFRNNNGTFSDITAVTVQETSSRVGSDLANQTLTKKGTSKTLNLNNLSLRLRNKLIKN